MTGAHNPRDQGVSDVVAALGTIAGGPDRRSATPGMGLADAIDAIDWKLAQFVREVLIEAGERDSVQAAKLAAIARAAADAAVPRPRPTPRRWWERRQAVALGRAGLTAASEPPVVLLPCLDDRPWKTFELVIDVFCPHDDGNTVISLDVQTDTESAEGILAFARNMGNPRAECEAGRVADLQMWGYHDDADHRCGGGFETIAGLRPNDLAHWLANAPTTLNGPGGSCEACERSFVVSRSPRRWWQR